MKIEKMSIDRLEETIDFLDRCYLAMEYKCSKFDKESVKKLLFSAIQDPSHLFLFAHENGRVVGFFGAFVIQNLFNLNEKMAQECCWQAEPTFSVTKRGRILIELFNYALIELKNRFCESIYITFSHNSIGSYLKRKGFGDVEYVMKGKIPCQAH